MARRTCYIATIYDLGLPMVLAKIIAEYAVMNEREKLDELFCIHNGRVSINNSDRGFIELIEIDDSIVKIRSSFLPPQSYWSRTTIINLFLNKELLYIISSAKLPNDLLNLARDCVDQIQSIWDAL